MVKYNVYDLYMKGFDFLRRSDGKRVKNVSPMYKIVPYIMNDRNDSLNMTSLYIPEEPVKKYINSKRKTENHLSHMSVLLSAYIRTLAEFPELNRFVVNKRVFARNEVSVALVIMRPGDAESTMTKIWFEPTDTVFDVNRRINDFLNDQKKEDATNGTDKLINALTNSHFLMNTVVGFVKWADKHGFLPKKLIDILPFHASLCFTNLASIRTGQIYHHIYNFGTISNFIAMGLPEKKLELMEDGTTKYVSYIPIGLVMDERTASGHTYALAFSRLKKYLANPELLESPPEKVNVDE